MSFAWSLINSSNHIVVTAVYKKNPVVYQFNHADGLHLAIMRASTVVLSMLKDGMSLKQVKDELVAQSDKMNQALERLDKTLSAAEKESMDVDTFYKRAWTGLYPRIDGGNWQAVQLTWLCNILAMLKLKVIKDDLDNGIGISVLPAGSKAMVQFMSLPPAK
jgi:uncharacterized protein YhaN